MFMDHIHFDVISAAMIHYDSPATFNGFFQCLSMLYSHSFYESLLR